MKYIMENEILKVTIRSKGAELTSIIKKETGTEYLWNAGPEYWNWTSPVLFPFVGGAREKQYHWQGKTYPMMQHGFARDYEFTLTKQEQDAIWFRFHENEETLRIYPFKFKLEIGYVLQENTIRVCWKVTNDNEEVLYFSIGAHPAFLCPLDGKGERTDYYMGFETDKEELQYRLINMETNLVERAEYPLTLENGLRRVEEDRFAKDALIFEHGQTHKMWLADPEKKPYVTVAFDTSIFGVWAPHKKGVPFICIEPWYGRSDANDFYGSLEEREYINTAQPNEVFEKSYTITIE